MTHTHDSLTTLPTGVPRYWDEAKRYLAQADPVLADVFKRFKGEDDVPLQSKGNLFSTLANAIVGQQISAVAAAAIWKRLLEAWGGPKPDVVAQYEVDELKALGLSRRKAEYLIGIAEAMPELSLFPWQSMAPKEVLDTLTSLRGVGPWTAEMVQIFVLLHPDILPLGDIGVIRAVEQLYHNSERLSKSEVEQIAESWRPYRTVAVWYLWRTIDAEPVEY